jgi:L-threonylcarbamoyladenylate synthase
MQAPPPRVLPFDAAAVAEAATLLRSGEVVAVPTETVYGLAADATRPDAVARIYAAKGRPSFNPLIVHVPDVVAAERVAVLDGDARALAERFWPGPLTLVLPARPGLARAVTAGLDTVAVRVPAHRAMRAVLDAVGRPLAAPSANRSNGLSPTRAGHVVASLGAAVPLVLDDGPCAAGVESTIVTGRTVLRPGPVTAEAIAAVLGRVEARVEGGPVTAPGQLATHYAPGKPLRLDAMAAGADEWLIGFGPVAGDDTLSATGDLAEAAARLFDALHRADEGPRPGIAVAPVPAVGLGVAINDRLSRAAHR